MVQHEFNDFASTLFSRFDMKKVLFVEGKVNGVDRGSSHQLTLHKEFPPALRAARKFFYLSGWNFHRNRSFAFQWTNWSNSNHHYSRFEQCLVDVVLKFA